MCPILKGRVEREWWTLCYCNDQHYTPSVRDSTEEKSKNLEIWFASPASTEYIGVKPTSSLSAN